MEYRQLGKTDVKISAVGLGTWNLSLDKEREAETLSYGLDLGMNFIDTAEVYRTEDIVGRAISGKKDVFVATKVSPTHFRYDDVIKACDSSLQRLGRKTIDLYQLHWPSSQVPIGETMRAMEKLVADGKVGYIGVSNFSVEELREAQAALKRNEIVSNQVEYSLLVRDIEKELLGYCRKEKVTVIAYSPFARGHLFDRKYAKLTQSLLALGKNHGKTVAQVALNWLVSKPGVVAIPKASKKEHVKEIAGACDWSLSRHDLELIDSFLSKHRRMSMARFARPVIKHSSTATRLLGWASGLMRKKK